MLVLVYLLAFIDLTDATSTPDPSINYVVDHHANWTIDSLQTAKIQEQLDSSVFENAYFGYTTKPHWFRIILPKEYRGVPMVIIIDYPTIPDLCLYDGAHLSQCAGRNIPIEKWPNVARNIVFDLPVNHSDTLYMRAHEKASLTVPIWIKTKDEYESDALIENILYGVYFGFVFALVLYNLMLYISLRDVAYFYYIVAMCCGGLLAVIRSGYAIVFWWPDNPVLDDRVYLIGAGLSIASSSRFVASFLNLPTRLKYVNYYMWFVTGLALLMVVLSFFYSFVELTTYGRILVIIGVPSFVSIGVHQWINGYRPARFFVIAWIPYTVGLMLIVLKGGGWIEYNMVVDLSAELGTCLEAILLSFALGDRISIYKKEKAAAELKVLESELENNRLEVRNKELDFELQLKDKDLQNEKQQLATTALWLTQKNELLKEIQQSLSNKNGASSALIKKLDQNLNAENDWNRVKGHFEKVHPNFFKVLYASFPDLTQNEHRLCAYLRMNLSTKEIAALLGVSINAIEQARRRLRKKLGINNTETNLLNFLQEL